MLSGQGPVAAVATLNQIINLNRCAKCGKHQGSWRLENADLYNAFAIIPVVEVDGHKLECAMCFECVFKGVKSLIDKNFKVLAGGEE